MKYFLGRKGANKGNAKYKKNVLSSEAFQNKHLLRLKLLWKGARSCTALFLVFNLQVCTLCLHLYSRVLNLGN